MGFIIESLIKSLAGRRVGSNIHLFEEVDSTNNVAFKLALSGAPEGTVVISDYQTNGKGRLNRAWQSPANRNLYTSIIIRPEIKPALAPQITLTAGVSVAELLSNYKNDGVTLKWPNDIQIKGKKISGILTEMKASSSDSVEFIIVGIGVNLNMKKQDFDASFRDASTSLKEETGEEVSRQDFAVKLYDSFEKWYAKWISHGFETVKQAWLGYSSVVGQSMKVVFNGDVQTGKAIGIDDSGALILIDHEGKENKILAGDASVVKD